MKYYLAVFLLVSLLFCLVACGENSPVESGVSSVTSSEESVSETSLVKSAETSNVESSTPSSDNTVTQASEPESDVSSVDESAEPSPEAVTSETLQNSLKEFQALIDSLRVENIGEIRVSMGNPGGTHEERTDDSEQIQQWLEMFRSIKIKRIEPYEALTGGGWVTFTIYDKQGMSVNFGLGSTGLLHFDLQTQMIREEMDEDLLISLLKEMGFPPAYTTGQGFW